MENSTFLAGEQKTAADILLFHGSVHESVSKTLNCGSTKQILNICFRIHGAVSKLDYQEKERCIHLSR